MRYSNEMRLKIAILKLAAIGDVTLACRALHEFATSHDVRLEVHWIIDKNLSGLAAALLESLETPIETLKFHPINSAVLFQGGLFEKSAQTFLMLKNLAQIAPEHLLILHRDTRYRKVLRFGFWGTIFNSDPTAGSHEITSYRAAFASLATKLKLKKKAGLRLAPAVRNKSGQIGILVGGAQSAKVTFEEKRWPHLQKYIELVLKNTNDRVILLGGPDDVNTAEKLITTLHGYEARIENKTGKYKLSELPVALSKLDCFVSVDSGLAHIASTVMRSPNQKIITLFGPTNFKVWSPVTIDHAKVEVITKAKDCAPCYSDDGKFNPCRFTGDEFQHCMRDISEKEVFDATYS